MLEAALAVLTVAGVYEYVYSLSPWGVPSWLAFPLLCVLAFGSMFLPMNLLITAAVASVAGFIHAGLRRRYEPPMVIPTRRGGLPPLP